MPESIHQIKPERKQHEAPLPDSRQRRVIREGVSSSRGAGPAAPPEKGARPGGGAEGNISWLPVRVQQNDSADEAAVKHVDHNLPWTSH